MVVHFPNRRHDHRVDDNWTEVVMDVACVPVWIRLAVGIPTDANMHVVTLVAPVIVPLVVRIIPVTAGIPLVVLMLAIVPLVVLMLAIVPLVVLMLAIVPLVVPGLVSRGAPHARACSRI